MLHSRRAITLGLSGVAAVGAGIGGAARGDVPVYAVRMQSGLNKPVFVGAPPGDPNHLFMVEQGTSGSARVRILDLTTNSFNAPTRSSPSTDWLRAASAASRDCSGWRSTPTTPPTATSI